MIYGTHVYVCMCGTCTWLQSNHDRESRSKSEREGEREGGKGKLVETEGGREGEREGGMLPYSMY